MPQLPMHVLIVGGGLGGLCLAQGLQQAGISVAVYERDATPVTRRQGYRIHIDARGATALRACLPPHLFELFSATASPPGRQVTIVNKRLKPLKVIGFPEARSGGPVKFNAGVDRLTLREILLAGLEEVVHFNKEFSHYEQQTDGGIQAYFTDGTVAGGDVLVAADGINSRIRQQFLPQAAVVDTGTRCIYGKTWLTNATRSLVPNFLHQGFSAVVGSRVSMAIGLVEFQHAPTEAAARFAPGVQFHAGGDYLMWSLNAARAQFAASDDELFQMDGPALKRLVAQKTKGWHPNLLALIAASDPSEIFPIAIRVSVPYEAWESTPVTLLGDAIHAMSPAGGSGANMALLDARLLCQSLISVVSQEKSLVQAIHAYEAQMLKDGFEAVRFSAGGGVLRAGKGSLLQRFWRVAQ